jgi:hypothetical protein
LAESFQQKEMSGEPIGMGVLADRAGDRGVGVRVEL